MTNYSESYIEDLTVDSTFKHEGCQRAYVKKIQNHVNLLVSQNAKCVEFSVQETSQKPTIVSVICHGNQMVYS